MDAVHVTDYLPSSVFSAGIEYHLYLNDVEDGLEIRYKNSDQDYLVCTVKGLLLTEYDVEDLANILEQLILTLV